MSDTYKPTEHDGLKEDGTPDKRVGTGQFAHGKVDPVEAGKSGGSATGGSGSDNSDSTGSSGADGSNYKPSENDGLKKDGTKDGRVKD